jgi:hypothetical protein
MRRGNLPYVKIGRRRLITRLHLEQFPGVPDIPAIALVTFGLYG